MNDMYDIAVVGSGFAGSIFAMIARRLGRSVVLVERGKHPRMVIGESSTPLSNLLIEEIADRYDLPVLRSLTRWGSWQRTHPEIGCGLKRGFSFFHHDLAEPKPPQNSSDDQLLVAASSHDEIADTHWYRADLDAFLVREAEKLGVRYLDEVQLEQVVDTGEAMVIRGLRDGSEVALQARLVVDATGPRGFLHRVLGLDEAPLPEYPRTCALYSHFGGVGRLCDLPGYKSSETPSYPIDDAAVHHVFDGGWVWVLHFKNGTTSAGVAATAECAEDLKLAEGAPSWQRLLDKLPTLKQQFANATQQQPFTYLSRLGFRSSKVVGDRWAMLPSAAGFVDPMFSTGFPLTLLGVGRLAEIVDRHWNAGVPRGDLDCYAATTDGELIATSRLLAALYQNMGNFRVFRSLALLYFAAASFAETARRLGKADQARSFLLHDQGVFGEGCRSLLHRVSTGVADRDVGAIEQEVRRIIDPIDVAGLGKSPSNGWYPVLAQDLVASAWKLEASPDEVNALLERVGFFSAGATTEPALHGDAKTNVG